jgi:hypothetical protein
MQLKHTEVPQWLSIERVLFDILRENPEALRRSIFVSIEEALIIKGHGCPSFMLIVYHRL